VTIYAVAVQVVYSYLYGSHRFDYIQQATAPASFASVSVMHNAVKLRLILRLGFRVGFSYFRELCEDR